MAPARRAGMDRMHAYELYERAWNEPERAAALLPGSPANRVARWDGRIEPRPAIARYKVGGPPLE